MANITKSVSITLTEDAMGFMEWLSEQRHTTVDEQLKSIFKAALLEEIVNNEEEYLQSRKLV